MSDLPDGWEWATLGELCEINPRKFEDAPEDDEEISLVRMSAVEEETGKIDASAAVRYGDYKTKSLAKFQENDVLFAKVTPCMENGKIAVASGLIGGRALGSSELVVLRPRGRVSAHYLMLWLLQPRVRSAAEKNMTGAVGLRRVPREYLEGLSVPSPPLTEQHRIVDALEEHLTRVNTGVESVNSALARSKTWTSVAREHLVNGESAGLEPSIEQWRVGELGEVVEKVEAGKSFTCENRPARDDEWGVLKVSAMTWGRFREEENKAVSHNEFASRTYEINPGDLLVSRANTPEYVGAPVLVGHCRRGLLLSDKSLRLNLRSSSDAEWLVSVLSSPSVRRQVSEASSGSKASMRNISQRSLLKTLIPIPPESFRSHIAAKNQDLDSRSASFRSLASSVLGRANQLRQSLFREAFAGRLVPQDPDDEPASVLLERIRAERESAPKAKAPRKRRTGKSRISEAQQQDTRIDSSMSPPAAPGKGTQDALELHL